MESIILAIESSCDDTSAAIIKNGKVVNNFVATQAIHEKYGGVVPELASREHHKHIIPVVEEVLRDAGVRKSDLSAVAFTQGPGLLGALLVGCSFAKAMALVLNIPLIAVNHMQAHILAHFIDAPVPKFPFLCLTVSGGHTQIVKVNDYLDMKVIGQTLDDAVGEAFDKCAKLMELPYPGGPLIDKFATNGNKGRFPFPDSAIKGLDYSFSGIKTAFMYFLRDQKKINPSFVEENKEDICASIQSALIKMLLQKLKRASKETGIKQIAIAGGVSANSALRTELLSLKDKLDWEIFIPDFQYCTDNAAMIAMTAYYKFINKDFETLSVAPDPRMKI